MPQLASKTLSKFDFLWTKIPADPSIPSSTYITLYPEIENSTIIRIYKAEENIWQSFRKFQDSWIPCEKLYNYISSIKLIKLASDRKFLVQWKRIHCSIDETSPSCVQPPHKKQKK